MANRSGHISAETPERQSRRRLARDCRSRLHESSNDKSPLLPALREMHCADEARVVRADDVTQFNRIIEVFDLKADEALLPVPAAARRIARRPVPTGRRDYLIIGDPAVFDLHPMPKATARGVDQATTDALCPRVRFDEGRLAEMLLQLHHRAAHLLKQSDGPVESRELP